MRRVLHRVLTFAAIFAGRGPVAAQTVTGTMQGTVTDTSGGVLPGVTLTLRNLETGVERTVLTNETGFYSAPFMPLRKLPPSVFRGPPGPAGIGAWRLAVVGGAQARVRHSFFDH